MKEKGKEKIKRDDGRRYEQTDKKRAGDLTKRKEEREESDEKQKGKGKER